MSVTNLFRPIIALITAAAAVTPALAADTGSSHNLFILHQLDKIERNLRI